MEACQAWIGGIADVATISSFIVSLSMSWRVFQRRNSSGVEFFPVAATTVCLQAWILYGGATGDSHVMWVNSLGFVVMIFNAVVHRTFSSRTGPGLYLAVTLVLFGTVSLASSAQWLGRIAAACAVVCNLSPVRRIKEKKPLPEIAAMTLVTCGLWTAYGALVGSWPLMASNGLGALVAAVELAAYLRMWRSCVAAMDAKLILTRVPGVSLRACLHSSSTTTVDRGHLAALKVVLQTRGRMFQSTTAAATWDQEK
ncbi:hypothetical protein HPB51_026556 [Rhipicephalus microplus]|uniref:Sugar transporter SWEET n=1 Tax=Rhipicephalus microplus TaxID=6941 RepID=A0A9J6D2S0_RHIMP|nr:hypothetical protein HPB51_026556 [Rhipicephalus microplus]